MQNNDIPKDYEELIRTIHERYDDMSKSYQQIAVYLTQNPNEVAVKSLNAMAEACGIHASSFVRFAQMLGYQGFKEVQAVFQRRLSTAAPGFEARVKALESELSDRRNLGASGFLHDLVLRDIASLQELLNSTTAQTIEQAVRLMEKADTIYLIGQLRSAPIVDLIRYVLTMLGKRAAVWQPIWRTVYVLRICCLRFRSGSTPRKSSTSSRKRPPEAFRSSQFPTRHCRRLPKTRPCFSPCRSTNTRSQDHWRRRCVWHRP